LLYFLISTLHLTFSEQVYLNLFILYPSATLHVRFYCNFKKSVPFSRSKFNYRNLFYCHLYNTNVLQSTSNSTDENEKPVFLNGGPPDAVRLQSPMYDVSVDVMEQHSTVKTLKDLTSAYCRDTARSSVVDSYIIIIIIISSSSSSSSGAQNCGERGSYGQKTSVGGLLEYFFIMAQSEKHVACTNSIN